MHQRAIRFFRSIIVEKGWHKPNFLFVMTQSIFLLHLYNCLKKLNDRL